MKRFLSIFLALALLLSGCMGSQPDGTTQPNQTTTGTEQVTTAPSTQPTDGTTLPTDGATQPTQEATQPTQEATQPTTAQHSHTDGNDDGTCDGCGNTVLVKIDLYNINDLHGKIADAANHPGVDEMTTYFKQAQWSNDHVIFLSSGDMWQGSSESNTTQGAIVTDWMNHVGFAAMAMGNHEYDWGPEAIQTNASAAWFPYLGINIYDRATNNRVSYCRPSVMVERGGVQIGIIGAIGDCYSSIASDHTNGIYFKTGSQLTALVKAEAQRLREQGADFIVYVLHDGYGNSTGNSVKPISNGQLSSYNDASLSNGYVDLEF